MGLFSSNEICFLCNGDTGFNKHKTIHGYLCQTCLSKLAERNVNMLNMKKFTVDELRQKLNEEATNQYLIKKQQKIDAKKELEAKVNKMKAEGIVFCPKCYSTQITANKRGFGIGKAAVGTSAFGALGFAAGGIGSKKVDITCLNCGHRWQAGKS